ncbi:MAG: metalloregulator ArsR/SmtB family transcription factor [Steroidobacteraceae bacterium]
MKETSVLRALGALAQANRLRVFRFLVVAGPSGATPGALAKRFRVSPATLSFHLKELVNAGLVTQERAGRNLIYRADYAVMSALLSYMTENCCGGATCDAPAAPGR